MGRGKQSIFILIVFVLWSCHSTVRKPTPTIEDRIAKGKVLFQYSGCIQCHSLAGEERYGPALDSILSKEVTIFHDGKKQKITIDRMFIFRAIQEPDHDKMEGFLEKKMPTPALTSEEIECLTEYLISVNKAKLNHTFHP